MAAITPAGFQNHIQNPLAAVLYAIMNGAFTNARDARETNYRVKQDADRARERDIDQALRLALAGGRGVSGTFQGQPEYDMIRSAEGIASKRDQDAADETAMKRQMQEAALARSKVETRSAQNEAVYNHPLFRALRGAGSEVSDILQAIIRSGGGGKGAQGDSIKALGNDSGFVTKDGKIYRLPPADSVPVLGADAPPPPAGTLPGAGTVVEPPQDDALGSYFERIIQEKGGARGGAYPLRTR